MGRYVLGILAVVVMQIAFSIYVSYNRSDDQTAVANSSNAYDKKADLTAENGPAATEPPTVAAEDADIDTAKPITADEAVRSGSRRTEAFARRVEFRVARSTGANMPRRSNFQNRIPAERVSVEREYFGRMVVEKTFWPAKFGINRSSAMVRRRKFGRMIVEHTSGV